MLMKSEGTGIDSTLNQEPDKIMGTGFDSIVKCFHKKTKQFILSI